MAQPTAAMSDLVLVPRSPRAPELDPDWPLAGLGLGPSDPVAEYNFNRKKILSLEQGVHTLQRTARQHHEVVAQIEGSMKSMISEADLRRAIGLAFQEFEQRLEDAFQDSNRKCLAMFSKRDEVSELEGLLAKKVNWAEYNAVLKKLADLRMYLDTMANDIFIGHREALNGEFRKKADKVMVEEALALKADWRAVDEVRGRLDSLETLVANTDARQTAALAALRSESAAARKALEEKHAALIGQNSAAVAALRTDLTAACERLHGAEGDIQQLSGTMERLREAHQQLSDKHEQVILPTMGGIQEQLAGLEAVAERTRDVLQRLKDDCKAFQDASTPKFDSLFTQAQHCKEQLEFLMQATDMIKRRSREMNKSTDSRFKEGSDDQERMGQQMAALEKQLKRHEHELRQLERTAARADAHSAAALLPLPAPESITDPSDRLKGVLEQLEKIGASGPPHERLGIEWNPKRPPLPFGGSDSARRGADAETARLQLPGLGTADPVPIDSARAASGRSQYASPRPALARKRQ